MVLQAAYLNKERAAQLEEEKLRVQMEAAEQARLDKLVEENLAKVRAIVAVCVGLRYVNRTLFD